MSSCLLSLMVTLLSGRSRSRIRLSKIPAGFWVCVCLQLLLGGVSAGAIEIKLLTSESVEGTVAVIRADLSEAEAVLAVKDPFNFKAVFAEREIPFFPLPEPRQFAAFLPVPYGYSPGVHPLAVVLGQEKYPLELTVKAGDYRSETLKVAPKHVKPNPKDEKRIARESHLIGVLYEMMTPERAWDGPFDLPIDSPITSPYGNRRVYNGQLKNYHAGSDLKAASGTPVHAAAAGVVRMAKNLYYTGNTVLVDHGYGVFTLYAHLSRMQVKVGQRVSHKGLLGLSGMTGRVTGPHLHWMAIVRKVRVDPVQLLEAVRLVAPAPTNQSSVASREGIER